MKSFQMKRFRFAPVLENDFKPKDFLGYLVSAVMKNMSALLVAGFKEQGHDISRAHWLILAKSYHFANEKLLQSDVVEMMLGDKITVSRAVDDLVNRGWLIQKVDKVDKRNRVLVLTTKGRQIVPELMKVVNKTIASATYNIDDNDMNITKAVLAAPALKK